MASKRPPLQLRFTVQGAKKVLPLNTENLRSVFDTGVLDKMDGFGNFAISLGSELLIPREHRYNPLSAADWWIRHCKDRRWRVLIYNFDRVGETGLADELIPYSEPPSDSSLTAERMTPIFMNMREWRRIVPLKGLITEIVPYARAGVICHQNPSDDDRRRQGATYYVNVYPWASWEDLAGQLYRGEETRAMEAFKVQIPKPRDSTLVPWAIMNATDGAEMPDSQSYPPYLDMPYATYDGIVRTQGTRDEGRKQLIFEFLSHHPYPRWELVFKLLKDLEKKGKARAGLAQEVEQKYLTMSDEKAQRIVETALEDGSLKQYYSISVVVGVNGSGKSCLVACLFHQTPPDLYTSTGIADQCFRSLAHFMANMGIDDWKLLSEEDFLQLLVQRLPASIFDANTSSLTATMNGREGEDFTPAITSHSFTTSHTADPSAPSHTLPHFTTPQGAQPLSERSHTGEAVVRLVRQANGSEQAFAVHLLHMIDTGGQPEFLEVLPSLIYNSNVTALVLNLAQSLDAYPEVAFYVDGNALKRPLPFALTNRQIAHQVAHTMIAKRSSRSKRSKLIVVGTHRDCVKGKLFKTLAAVNKALKEIFLPSLKDELIVYRSCNEIIFPVNSIHPDEDDHSVFESIRNRISEAGADEESNTPIAFFIFEQDILKLAKRLGREILHTDECQQVGGVLKMSQEKVQAALIYFHQRNIFVYFQHVLPEIMFTNPQVPLNFFKALVLFSYKVQSSHYCGLPVAYIDLLKKGMISEEMLHHDSFKECFIPGIYEPQHAIKLFHHLYTIAPLSEEEPAVDSQQFPRTLSSEAKQKLSRLRRGEFLMMSLLAPLPEKKIKKVLATPSKVATLLIHFSTECIPNGCFSSTIACAISEYKWKICYSDINRSEPECVSHNAVTLCPHNHPGKVTLVNSTHYLQIHIDTNGIKDKHLNWLCTKIQTIILSVLKKVFERMHFTEIELQPAFLCPCKPTSKLHTATICPEPPVTTDSYLVCSRTRKTIGNLELRQRVWFEGCEMEKRNEKPTSAASSSLEDASGIETKTALGKCPSLIELIRFRGRSRRINIPQEVGTKFRQFGILLLHDPTGNHIENIIHKCRGNPEDINMEILQDWVKGEGEPLTWEALVETLEDIGLSTLAKDIRDVKI